MTKTKKQQLQLDVGSAVDKDMYYMACSFIHSEEPHTRLFFYQHKNKDKWFYHDLPGWTVVSTAFPPHQHIENRKIYALSSEGDVECFSRNLITKEKISDAGIKTPGKNYGYLSTIRFISDTLYACGHRGQVYKKTENGWAHFDDDLLQPPIELDIYSNIPLEEQVSASLKQTISLSDINGHKNNIYTIGHRGFIAHHDGIRWKKLKKITAADLYGIHSTPDGTWLVGANGTLLYGDAIKGFKVLNRKSTNADFYSATRFNDSIYISASDGIYEYRNNNLTKLKIHAQEVSCIEEKDGVVWALSSDKLLRYDGNSWEEFRHIDNL